MSIRLSRDNTYPEATTERRATPVRIPGTFAAQSMYWKLITFVIVVGIVILMLVSFAAANGVYLPTNPAELVIFETRMAHEYVNDTYTCLNYSTDAYWKLTKLGYKADVIAGYMANSTSNYTRGHAWIRLYTHDGYKDYDVTSGLTLVMWKYDHYSKINMTDRSYIKLT